MEFANDPFATDQQDLSAEIMKPKHCVSMIIFETGIKMRQWHGYSGDSSREAGGYDNPDSEHRCM